MEDLDKGLREALEDLAEGRVQRSRHDLVVDGRDLSEAFQGVLKATGYQPYRLRDLAVPRGMRFPAFVVFGGRTDFGHVFQEKFNENEYRLLFGSVVRDWRGDWEVMLTRRSPQTVWVDLKHPVPFDEDRPSAGR